ncbi:hypothetical protein [Methylobacterium brachythecii]|uniref:C2H2-type domain-containing protein n=1 Tax=Methylobacterium brachythecii TaxID=1176177 RepID=A0A7W6AKE6_9HYPH|nr:hypothetical protein [Methylobacterium brachythecii]MBB3905078.1 hypothetical protein [Methylobacterium brachythecii]GLS44414.1 hypothetical protein GCM10007884_24020 [Methylobacterium brachythecii]
MSADRSFTCPHCARVLADENGLFCHIQGRHGRAKARLAVPKHPSAIRENVRNANARHRAAAEHDREPSMADLQIEALQARAAGEPVEDWIAEMFDV